MERSKSRLANDAWEALLTAHAVLLKQMLATDIWDEVSIREYDVLYTLSKCPQPIRAQELNQHILLSQPALSRLVDRLVDRGLVGRSADPADGRAVRLSLTEHGLNVQRRVGGRHAVDVAGLVGAELNREELRILEELCLKLAGGRPVAGTRNKLLGRPATQTAREAGS